VVFYELLTGELPMGSFPPPSRKAGVDARLDGVVLRAMQREPRERYQHMSEMKTAVEAVAQAPPWPALAVQTLSPLWREVGITAVMVAGVALVLLLCRVCISKNAWFYVSLWSLLGVFAAVCCLTVSNRYLVRLLVVCGLVSSVSLTIYEIVGPGGLGCLLFPLWLFGMTWFSRIFFSTFPRSGLASEEEKPVAGLTPVEEALRQRLLRARKPTVNSEGLTDPSLSVLPNIDGELLARARKSCGVSAEEQVLGVLRLGEDWTAVLGCRALYYPKAGKSKQAAGNCIPYAELSQRPIVNHGTAVYLGNDQYLTPPAEGDQIGGECEKITHILHEIQQLFASAPPPGAKTESS
jgi:hypothetical protein